LILPETFTANDVLLCCTSFRYQLRRSLFQVLNEGLRGVAGPAAWRDLEKARDALYDGSLDIALRNLDRAWRCLPQDAAALAPIYGRLLALEGRDYSAALGLLQRAADLAPHPDVAALIALSLLCLQRPEDARRHVEEAIAEFCVVPGGLLFHVAGAVMRHPAIRAPGWIGYGPSLELLGELAPDEPSNVLDIAIDGQRAFTQLLRRSTRRESGANFSFPSAKLSLHTPLEVSSCGMPLIGSGARIPSDFALDGRAVSSGSHINGWVRIGWLPKRPSRVRIEDENGFRATAATKQVALPGGRWPFTADMRAAGLQGSRIRISAHLPDGRWQSLPDTPLLLEREVGPALRLRKWGVNPRRARPRRGVMKRSRSIDVIIPVYRGREETLACIDSVLATVDHDVCVIAVDDATDDPALAAALDVLAAEQRITLLRNTENQGFVTSANRALAVHPTHDAVLLNSDTLVFDDWLERLRGAAYSGLAVGTVTPLSNSGSIASYPHAQGAAVSPEYAAALHGLATSTHPGVRVEIPVGVGFCLYVRRDCLRDVGNLDAAVFGKGYGEEADFCMRGRRRGWSHQLAADVFVYHAGGMSFGGRRAAALDRSQRLLNLRHPGYDSFIANFLAKDPLHFVRRRLDEHRLSAFQGRFVLMVTLAMTGGVVRFVDERCRSLRAQGFFPLLLRPVEAGNSHRCELWTDAMEVPNLRYDIPKDLEALTALLGALRLEAIEIQHFLHLDARVIDAVRTLSIPYDVFIHDYAWICPRVTLIDGSGRYCGEPAVSVCQRCVRRNGSSLGETISVPALRARSDRWLRAARRIIAPSADTATRLRRHFNGLEVDVQPHTAPVVPTSVPPRDAQSKAIRVALIGAIGDHKGYQILLACARDARARRLPIEFIVIGYTANDAPLIATGKVFITGRYTDAEAPYLLRREQPDLVWLPSVWPETWCYTLDYALEAALPVLAFDLGAIADRLRAAGVGALMPLELKPRRVNDRLMQLVGGTQLSNRAARRSVQSQLLPAPNDANMVATHFDEIRMDKASDEKSAQVAQEEGMSASVQILPLPAGLYLFSVKAASPAPPRADGELSLPAVHVGLGPGVRTDQVEFIAGPNTHGAWLFAEGDLLVTKVNGGGAALIMTSVRAPSGDVLSIKVEKLEARATDVLPSQTVPTTEHVIQSTSAAAPKRPRNALAQESARSVVSSAANDQLLPVQTLVHVRARGDMTFADVPWAGRVAPGLWIEAFAVRPLRLLAAQDVEYKGLTGSGFETPWLSDEKMCGTKGMAVPLVGFAVRLKPSAATAAYDCEYSGYFQSGVTVGPLRNGAPCRSTVANDPLEGIQVRLMKRASATLPSGTSPSAAAAKETKPAERGIRPRSDLSGAHSNRRPSTRRP
jgi:GT2 family glycosyltransferase